MDGSVKDLSVYRFSTAKENLQAAKDMFLDGHFKSSVNRSYYAIFQALRAITALDQYDSRIRITIESWLVSFSP